MIVCFCISQVTIWIPTITKIKLRLGTCERFMGFNSKVYYDAHSLTVELDFFFPSSFTNELSLNNGECGLLKYVFKYLTTFMSNCTLFLYDLLKFKLNDLVIKLLSY